MVIGKGVKRRGGIEEGTTILSSEALTRLHPTGPFNSGFNPVRNSIRIVDLVLLSSFDLTESV